MRSKKETYGLPGKPVRPSMSETRNPSWNQLYELARSQRGYFRIAQAAEVGFSKQLLRKHVLGGRLSHELRGVYRLAGSPSADDDELVALWLWSGEVGVFSHETALSLFQLSDALPARVHMTVPLAWRRTAALPPLLVLHHADLPEDDRTWIGPVPVTTVGRTLRDAVDAGIDPTLIAQAISEGTARKILVRADVRGIVPPKRRAREARRRGGTK